MGILVEWDQKNLGSYFMGRKCWGKESILNFITAGHNDWISCALYGDGRVGFTVEHNIDASSPVLFVKGITQYFPVIFEVGH